jgi:hypothetical protein
MDTVKSKTISINDQIVAIRIQSLSQKNLLMILRFSKTH